MSRIRRAIKISKVGDGNGVKGLLERRAFQALEKHLNEKENKTLKGMPALLTTAVDRYGMGEAMVDAGLDLTIGDLMFALGLPFPVKKLSTVRVIAATLLPVITRLPFTWFYALGAEQDQAQIAVEQHHHRRQVVEDLLQDRALHGWSVFHETGTSKNRTTPGGPGGVSGSAA